MKEDGKLVEVPEGIQQGNEDDAHQEGRRQKKLLHPVCGDELAGGQKKRQCPDAVGKGRQQQNGGRLIEQHGGQSGTSCAPPELGCGPIALLSFFFCVFPGLDTFHGFSTPLLIKISLTQIRDGCL